MKQIAIAIILAITLAPPLFAEESPTTPYSLENCIEISLTKSPSVLSAAEELKRAKGTLWETWTEIISVNLSADYSYRGDVLPGDPFSPLTENDDFSVSIEGSIPVFSGGRVINGVLSAYLVRDIARENYRKAVNETMYNVTKTFNEILLSRELVRVREEEVSFLTRNFETTREKYDVGMASWFEMLRGEVELTNAEPALMEAEDSLTNASDNLKKTLGMDIRDALEIEGELSYREAAIDLDECISKALMQNPDLLIASFEEEVVWKKVRSVIGEYFPTISLFGRYEYTSDRVDIEFHHDLWEYTGGVSALMPLTGLLSISARLKQARAEYEKARIVRDDVENGIKLEVKKAYQDLTRSRKIVESQSKNVLLAKEGLDIAEIQYENGINTYLELMDTRLALTQANLNYVNAVFDYLEALARLKKLMGEYTDAPDAQANEKPDISGEPPR